MPTIFHPSARLPSKCHHLRRIFKYLRSKSGPCLPVNCTIVHMLRVSIGFGIWQDERMEKKSSEKTQILPTLFSDQTVPTASEAFWTVPNSFFKLRKKPPNNELAEKKKIRKRNKIILIINMMRRNWWKYFFIQWENLILLSWRAHTKHFCTTIFIYFNSIQA